MLAQAGSTLRMKYTELKDLTAEELTAKSRDLRQEIFNLRLQQASSQLEKPGRLRTIRRDVARIETKISELRSKETANAA
ncbi:MAG TPA: 50S ribosomal protein L29 [Candidatus Limnocylindria bacterium]|nr:50S ribosomal protein L29 [Candidatus Limnocylindria bacterium]